MRAFLFAFCLLCLSQKQIAQNAPATVREFEQTFTTYPFSDPDPVPKAGVLYPYFRYDGFTQRPVEKKWKVVELENEWIKIQIMPQVGGKIWSAIEKSTGKAFIYNNQVVKFRDIAMRGPWTSGGIEANYGIIGHTPACAVPVNYLTRKNPDGSVSCFIGTLDLLTNTRWTLEIALPADKAWFTTRSFWHNASPLEQPYYTWMNVGIKAAGNLEFTYEGTHYLGHEGEISPWRKDDAGRDLAWYEKNDFGTYKSYHVFGRYTNFFGGYWHDEDFGMGRYSSRDDKPGKKIWIWGLSQQGMIWEDLLTDRDGQYVEVQSGRLFNQSAAGSVVTPFKYRGFSPYSTDTWKEYWFPVLKTGGILAASPAGVLNVSHQNNERSIAFCPLEKINDSLKIFKKGDLIFSKYLKINPLETIKFSIPFAGEDADLRIELGQRLLQWQGDSVKNNLNRPVRLPADFQHNAAYGQYLQAKAKAEQRYYAEALHLYDASLAQQPYFIPALTGKAMVLQHLCRYTDAAQCARTALSIDTYDPEANYLWGLSNAALGHLPDAKDGFELASASVSYRSAAFYELAKIYFRNAEWAEAQRYAEKALEGNQYHISALQLLVVLHRRQNHAAAAQTTLETIARYDPLNLFCIFEKNGANGQNESEIRSFCRDELPQENFLELAAWYTDLGCTDDAERLLLLAPECPEQYYRLAKINAVKMPAKADAYLQKALSLPPDQVLPARPDLSPILQWASDRQPHWKTYYYAGLLALSHGDTLAATNHWLKCAESPDFAPFYIARAQLLKKGQPKVAERDLLLAVEKAPDTWRPYQYLTKFYTAQGENSKALHTATAGFKRFPNSYILGMEYAGALLANDRYTDCAAVLDTLHVIPYEGATDGRNLYRNACLLSGMEALQQNKPEQTLQWVEKSMLWPKHLGVGKPYDADIDLRVESLIQSMAYKKQGNTAMYQQALARAAAPATDPGFAASEYAAALALKALGREKEGLLRLKAWEKARPDHPLAKWAVAAFNKKAKTEPPAGTNQLIYKKL